MKAIQITNSSLEGITVIDKEIPIPKSNQVLIRVKCSTVCQGDVKLRKIPKVILVPIGFLFGFKPMATPGVEFSGIVESVGEKVTKFKPGDQVVGTATSLAYGGNAEYLVVPEVRKVGVLIHKPHNLTFPQAAALPVGAMTAYQMLQKVGVQANTSILIYGASGSVGTYAIQLAKHYSMVVTGVSSTANQELLTSLGVDHVLDYTNPSSFPPNHRFDCVLDCVGKLSSKQIKQLLKGDGRARSVKLPTNEVESELKILTQLADQGVLKPIIDRSFPLSQVREAHEYVETGRKVGNVVIEIS
jgi:NADPH:quinone reductase-like Zn-dependent oxidoreductase